MKRPTCSTLALTLLAVLALLLGAAALVEARSRHSGHGSRAPLASSTPPSTSARSTPTTTTTRGSRPPEIIRGVNLGGWLVLEPWITPSLFAPFINATTPAVDEYTFTQILGPEEATRQLTAHWDSWVRESDLQTLAAAGITHVRIPVGYWLVSIDKSEPFVYGGWAFLVRALGWCQAVGLKVLIDLHGVPGSQNGFDNSGRRGDIHWADQPPTNYFRSLAVLANLTAMILPYSAEQGGPVTGIELVNEPFVTVPLSFVQSYYTDGYDIVRGNSSADPTQGLDVVIHDSFRLGAWNGFLAPPQHQNVYLDTHVYHVFDMGLLAKTPQEHLDYTCTTIAASEASAAESLWLVTGEWSLATTDCATWLNGMLKGARWDGTLNPGVAGLGNCTGDAGNDFEEFSPDYLAFLRKMAESQMDVYENASGAADSGSAGWYFWNFRTESSPQWDFLLGLEKGYIPNPVTERTFSCAKRREELSEETQQHEQPKPNRHPRAPWNHKPRRRSAAAPAAAPVAAAAAAAAAPASAAPRSAKEEIFLTV